MKASLLALLLSAFPVPQELTLELVLLTRSDQGQVYCALWSSAEGYPTRRADAVFEGRALTIRGRRARMQLRPPPGTYAAACFHDENANRRLDTSFIGIPSEGTGASNDAKGFMGPPSFEDARFTLTSTRTLTIRMQYF